MAERLRASGTRRRLRRLRARLMREWQEGEEPRVYAARCVELARAEMGRIVRRLPEV